jgi:hypothetical protein
MGAPIPSSSHAMIRMDDALAKERLAARMLMMVIDPAIQVKSLMLAGLPRTSRCRWPSIRPKSFRGSSAWRWNSAKRTRPA